MSTSLGEVTTAYARKLQVLVEDANTFLVVYDTQAGENVSSVLTREECATLGTLLLEAAMGHERIET